MTHAPRNTGSSPHAPHPAPRLRAGTAALLCLCMAMLAVPAAAQTPGVTKDEILIGTLQDFSGPLASVSKEIANAMTVRIEEINASGGIHGRKLRIVMEDTGYEPKRAILGTQKLMLQDKVFAMVAPVGSAVALAAMPLLIEKSVPMLFPLTSTTAVYEPFQKYVFSNLVSNVQQSAVAIKWMAKDRNAKNFCVMYQDDDFGYEILRGAEQGLKDLKLPLVEKVSYKRGATEFAAQVAKTKASGCETILIGSLVRETIGIMGEARKLGWSPQFIATNNAFFPQVPKLGGATVEGLHATFQVEQPDSSHPNKEVRDWAAKYKARFGEEPGLGSFYGYNDIDTFAQAARAAGPNLTVASLINALETTPIKRDMFGSPDFRYSATNHAGNTKLRIAVIKDGKWVPVTPDFLDY